MSDIVQAMIRSMPTHQSRDPFDALHWTLAREIERLERDLTQVEGQRHENLMNYEALIAEARERGWIGWSRVGGMYETKPCPECGARARSYHAKPCSKSGV